VRRLIRSLLLLAILGSGRLLADDRPIRIVTLSTVLTEVARQVGGTQVAVNGLVAPGIDPHTFNPSPRDIRAMVDADLVLASGLNVEGYLNRLLTNDVSTGRVILVGDALASPITSMTRNGVIEEDPHWWHSIDNVIAASEIVKAELIHLRPRCAPEFSTNARDYSARLTVLKEWVASEVQKIPAGGRILVTSHDAFGYFARDYGFTVQSINGYSTDGEPDARRVASVVDLVRSHGIRAVFVEGGTNSALVENLRRETGVSLGPTLYADGLGPAGSGAETYESMYRANVAAIVAGLATR
jgi:zinc/manganese transport system substrate-binding protein